MKMKTINLAILAIAVILIVGVSSKSGKSHHKKIKQDKDLFQPAQSAQCIIIFNIFRISISC